MARAGYGRGAAAGGGGAPPARRVDPKLKLYNMIRWMNYLLFPLTGVIFVIVGVIMCFMEKPDGLFMKPLAIIIGGGILAYVSIFYNKR